VVIRDVLDAEGFQERLDLAALEDFDRVLDSLLHRSRLPRYCSVSL
jgi:hypothetical protein